MAALWKAPHYCWNILCSRDMFKSRVTNTANQEAALGTATHHELLCVCTDFEQLGYSVHKALMVKVAHLLDLTVVVSYSGIQLLHEALVGVGLVIINWPENNRVRRWVRSSAGQGTGWSGWLMEGRVEMFAVCTILKAKLFRLFLILFLF